MNEIHQQPLVSVNCIVFNHSKFIRNAINGFLIQKTNFPYEIVIHDDASTDGTADIIREYENEYPEKIKAIYQKENQYSKGVKISAQITWPKCRGKYIAMCEGDDYWTDPLKLQKQVDFLESNPNYAMCFHGVNIVGELSQGYKYAIPPQEKLSFKDLLLKHYIPTCSLLFRKEFLPDPLPEWYYKLRIGDIPLELLLADKGLTKFFPDVMASYRKHDGGITNDIVQKQMGRKTYLSIYQNLNKHFRYKYWLLLSYMIIRTRLGYVKDVLKNKYMRKSSN